MLKNPCYKCPERHYKCHGECQKYIEWQAEREKINAARRKAIEANLYKSDEIIDRYIKWVKSRPK